MRLYDGPTPKRHVAYSNSPTIARLDLGRLQGWAKKARQDEASGVERVKLVTKYIDKAGKKRYKGSASLPSSESESQLLNSTTWRHYLIKNVAKVAEYLYLVDLSRSSCLANCQGTIQKSLGESWSPSFPTWSVTSVDCLLSLTGFRLLRKPFPRWLLMTIGRMPKWCHYATGYGVGNIWTSRKVSETFYPKNCRCFDYSNMAVTGPCWKASCPKLIQYQTHAESAHLYP